MHSKRGEGMESFNMTDYVKEIVRPVRCFPDQTKLIFRTSHNISREVGREVQDIESGVKYLYGYDKLHYRKQ
jgi:hypothetical protein